MSKLRVVSFGLGPIGQAAARLALTKDSIEVVAAVDSDPAKAGADLGELLGLGSNGVPVEADLAAVLEKTEPDVALHCTSSFLPVVVEQLEELGRAGIHVVSSSEELLVPDLQRPEIAQQIDAAARTGGATVLGTGVNPGFVMDFMAVLSSAVCDEVRSVQCARVVDAGTRREPLQRKVGASLTTEEFAAQEKTGRFGHIGMRESVALVGRGLGLELDQIEQILAPVVAEREHVTQFLTVPAGGVAGIHNVGLGKRNGETIVELDLKMYVGAEDPRDEIHLTGSPDVHLSFAGGVPGDQATAAILVNWLPQVAAATPGLKTVLDLPAPRCVR